jgi:TRAP-type transport system periplasmic protein
LCIKGWHLSENNISKKEEKMKKSFKVGLSISFFLIAIASSAVVFPAPIIIKVGHNSMDTIAVPGAGNAAGLLVMKNYVEAETNGEIQIEVHPNSALGAPRAMMELCQKGVAQMVLSYNAAMIPFCEEVGVTQIPYLFRDTVIATRVLNGPFGEELTQQFLKKTGVRVLAWPEGGGFRNLYTRDKQVKSPADMKGMKIRVPENPGLLAMFQSWGAKTVTVTWTETYTAMQTGVAEGCDTEIYSADSVKLFEVLKYITMTVHGHNVHTWMINDKFFQSLSEKNRHIIMKGVELAATVQIGHTRLSEIATIEKLTKLGIKVYYPNEKELKEFKDLGQNAYVKMIEKRIGREWIDKMFKAVAKTEQEVDQEYKRKMK